MLKLDVKDRKLLEIYTDNAGIPLGQLAKLVGVSREVATYRLKRLKKLGIMPKIMARVDMTMFYNNAYAMFMRFSKLDAEFLKSATDFLVKNPLVMWVASLGGEYDIGITFLTRNPGDLSNLMQQIEREFGKNLQEYDLFPYERELKNTYRGVFLTKQTQLSEAFLKEFSPQRLDTKLDEKDKTLLYALSQNAELTNSQLAKLVGLSEEAVRLRKKNYEQRGIIHGYRGVIDVQKMGISAYYIFLRLDNMSVSQERKFETYIQMSPHIYYCAKIIGKFNVQACIWATSPTQYQAILQDIRNTFSENLVSFRTQIMFGDHKHTYFPPAAIMEEAGVEKVDDFLSYGHII